MKSKMKKKPEDRPIPLFTRFYKPQMIKLKALIKMLKINKSAVLRLAIDRLYHSETKVNTSDASFLDVHTKNYD